MLGRNIKQDKKMESAMEGPGGGMSFYTSGRERPHLKEVKRKRTLSFSGGSTFQVQETAVQRPWGGSILVSVVVEQCAKPLCREKNKQGE